MKKSKSHSQAISYKTPMPENLGRLIENHNHMNHHQHLAQLQKRRCSNDLAKLMTDLDRNLHNHNVSFRMAEEQTKEQLKRLKKATGSSVSRMQVSSSTSQDNDFSEKQLTHMRSTPSARVGQSRDHISHVTRDSAGHGLERGLRLPALDKHKTATVRDRHHTARSSLPNFFYELQPMDYQSSKIYGRRRFKQGAALQEALGKMVKSPDLPFDPYSVLRCRYLRLSDNNIAQLERQCLAGGSSPGLHPYMSSEQVMQYFQSHPALPSLHQTPSPLKVRGTRQDK